MKTVKGAPGYIRKHKRNVILKAILQFGIVAALLALGVVETKSRLNLLTLVAVLGCLPASKTLVEVIMMFPHTSIDSKTAEEIRNATGNLTTCYDLILTSEKEIMPVDCIVIYDNQICGYTSHAKTNTEFAAKHIKQMLYANQYTNVTVKIFDQYHTFITRAEQLNALAQGVGVKTEDKGILSVILNLSL